MAAQFEIKKSKNGQFYFNLKAGNGEVVLTSEQYTSKAGAKNGIASVQNNADDASRYETKTAKNGKHYFVLKAGNHQVIGVSETYNTEGACAKGIAAVKKAAGSAATSDET
ncbi:MAG TPA: YegP family protein [Gemmatales bacterium]|nr:YegP family protein [Gemmatales bacterium]